MIQSTISLGSSGFNHTLMMGQEAAKNGDGLDVSYMQDEALAKDGEPSKKKAKA
jgi:hypothetical protein